MSTLKPLAAVNLQCRSGALDGIVGREEHCCFADILGHSQSTSG
jgi:hypothetical protein